MKMTIEEKKVLYAFGCRNREATVKRFLLLAAAAPDPAVKKFFVQLAKKLDEETADSWFRTFFHHIRVEMESYFEAEDHLSRLEEVCEYGGEMYGEADEV